MSPMNFEQHEVVVEEKILQENTSMVEPISGLLRIPNRETAHIKVERNDLTRDSVLRTTSESPRIVAGREQKVRSAHLITALKQCAFIAKNYKNYLIHRLVQNTSVPQLSLTTAFVVRYYTQDGVCTLTFACIPGTPCNARRS